MLVRVERETYYIAIDSGEVPEHPVHTVEHRTPGSCFYVWRYHQTEKQQMYAMHDSQGNYWIDEAILKRLGLDNL